MLKRNNAKLISPYGGKLINLLVAKNERIEIFQKALHLPSIQLSPRALQDLELLAIGAFSPLDRFMSKLDYDHVLDDMRLMNGMIFPVPITLPVVDRHRVFIDKEIILRNTRNEIIAIMLVQEIYKKNFLKESHSVYGTTDSRHPLISEMFNWGEYYVSGPIKVIQIPSHYNFLELRQTPKQIRKVLSTMGKSNVVSFHTRNPIHRAHEALIKHAAEVIDGTILIHPTVGLTKPDDIDYFTRILTYKKMYELYFNHTSTALSVIPLAMRFAGPREAVWHAIVRRNYGANHFIVGRNHASPGLNSNNRPFYPPEAAQKLMQQVKKDICITPVIINEVVYLPQQRRYIELNQLFPKQKYISVSGTNIRNFYLNKGKQPPDWLIRPEIASLLSEAFVPDNKRGFCIWFTGLPCSGKSTIASILRTLLQNRGRRVTLLDGDVIRTHLSKGLGYTKPDRDTNILRIGFVASEIVKHNGVAICATVSPFEHTRNQVRHMMPANAFILVHVDTVITICEKRDYKGMYKQAKKGIIKHFTGIDDPYETPIAPEIRLNTKTTKPHTNANKIIIFLTNKGLL